MTTRSKMTEGDTSTTDTGTEDHLSVRSLLDCELNWNYQEQFPALSRLYEIAKAKSWNASERISWDTGGRPKGYPSKDEHNPFLGFYDYEQLSEDMKQSVSWWRHSLEISEILHGEQGALVIASQLVSCLPDIDAKLFASSQVHDEARHVEFFKGYLSAIGSPIHRPSKHIKSLLSFAINDTRWDIKFIICQILIESLAMAQFQELKRTARLAPLREGLDLIAKDEARHVKFGTTYLKEYLSTLDADQLQMRCDLVLDAVFSLANSLNIHTRIAEHLGWNVNELIMHLRKYRIRNREVDVDRFRQLTLSMSSVGLLTDKSKQRLDRINLLHQ